MKNVSRNIKLMHIHQSVIFHDGWLYVTSKLKRGLHILHEDCTYQVHKHLTRNTLRWLA